MSRRNRCPRCQRPVSHCLCASIPSLASRSRVLILQHPEESRHALNTARLAALGLRSAELWVGEQFPELPARLASEPDAMLLFPGEQAQPLHRLTPEAPGPLLVVPDGTWRKARKLLYLNPCLERLPRVCLASPPVSRYRLRKAPSADALSTLEAIAAALDTLEAPLRFDALLTPFEQLIEGQISAMGQATYQRNHGG